MDLEETDAEATPDEGADASEAPRVDKYAAVRELSDLFNRSEADASVPAFVPAEPKHEAEENGDAAVDEVAVRAPHWIEDDEEITRSLISRLIDGVKGL